MPASPTLARSVAALLAALRRLLALWAAPRRTLLVGGSDRAALERAGLDTPEAFLALAGVVVSGHPDRHVMRVRLTLDGRRVTAYLKREHRVPLKDRLRHFLGGWGFASKSLVEAGVLARLHRAGQPCPRWLAAGEAGGRAFLLVRAVAGSVELRQLLAAGTVPRRLLARRLGAALARLHDDGFDHRDLSAKHVLVDPARLRFTLIDWQRAARGPSLSWRCRARALALLTATVAPGLASDRDRLAVLAGYARACASPPARDWLRIVLAAVRDRAAALARRRSVRLQCQAAVSAGERVLLWPEGDESVCVVPGHADGVLSPGLRPKLYADAGTEEVTTPDGKRWVLHRREEAGVRVWLAGRRWRSPEVRAAGRHLQDGKLVAFGQDVRRRGRVRSFLLLEGGGECSPSGTD